MLERLTKSRENVAKVELVIGKKVTCRIDGCDIPYDNCKQCIVKPIINRLAELEDLLEDGKLIELIRCKDCIEVDYSGCKNGTVYCCKHTCYMQENNYCSEGHDKREG